MRSIIFLLALLLSSPGYTQGVLPPGELPLKVYVSFYIADIDGVNTAEQSFKARLFIRYRWQDIRNAHTGEAPITQLLESIWHPNIHIINQQKVQNTSSSQAKIMPDGSVVYRQAIWGSFSQPLKLKDFPFDKQRFTFQLVSVGYSHDQIEFLGDPEEQGEFAFNMHPDPSLADWQVTGFHYKAAPFQPVHNLEMYNPGIAFSFEAERLISYFVVKMILPLILIVMMSWAVFWMDPLNVAGNVGISVTSMLTLIAYRFSADATLPRLPYLTSLDYFILSSTILVFLSLLQNLTTSTLAKQGKLKQSHKLDIMCRIGFPLMFFLLTLETMVFRAIF